MFDDHHTSRIVYDNTLPAVLQHLENGWPLRFNDDWWATAEVDLVSRLPSRWRLVRLRIAPQRQWLNAAIDLLEAGIDVRPQDDILKTLEAALGPRFEGSDIPWVHFLGLVDHFEDHIIVISDDEEPKVSRLGNLVELLLTPATDHR